MAAVASSSQAPPPLPHDPRTTLVYQRMLDQEFVPVVEKQIKGIALVSTPFAKAGDAGNILYGTETQSGFVVDAGIITSAHGLMDWDLSAFGWRIRPIEVRSIGRINVRQNVRALAIDSGTDLALLEMPCLPEGFPLHVFEFSTSAPQTGEHVHTIGHPGPYDYSTRDGRVSFPERQVCTVIPNPDRMPPGFCLVEVGFLAPPGFSGGPMIDTVGQVVSVNHCIENAAYNFVSLSVPSVYARDLIWWHGLYPNLCFARSDGAIEYLVGENPMDGLQIEDVRAGVEEVGEEPGDVDAAGVTTDFILDSPEDGGIV